MVDRKDTGCFVTQLALHSQTLLLLQQLASYRSCEAQGELCSRVTGEMAGHTGPEWCSPERVAQLGETGALGGQRLLVPPVLVPHCAGPTRHGTAVGWRVNAARDVVCETGTKSSQPRTFCNTR